MSSPTPFHRLFGLSWIDFFDGTDIEVETELDLSVKKQLIDIVIVRKGPGPIPRRLPDGFDTLAQHNLVTFKSYQETLEVWTLLELIGHFVNYCKRVSPSLDDLLPRSEFRLFAVSARYPANLAKEVNLVSVKPGVYDVVGVGLTIRVIVVNELPKEENNAMLHLFSAREELIKYGQEHYHPYSTGTSTLLYQLINAYDEDQNMHAKMKEFVRETMDELLKKLPPEERLKGLSADEVIHALTPEMREELARYFKGKGSSPKPE